jgi:hypothetical protein
MNGFLNGNATPGTRRRPLNLATRAGERFGEGRHIASSRLTTSRYDIVDNCLSNNGSISWLRAWTAPSAKQNSTIPVWSLLKRTGLSLGSDGALAAHMTPPPIQE